MKVKLIPVLLALLPLFFACKKQALPESAVNSPEFYAKADLDGSEINLEAGNNGYYMFSSHYLDSVSKVDVYKAYLNQPGCSPACGYALAILVNDAKMNTQGAPMRVDSALLPGLHLYNDITADPLFYTAVFVPQKAYVSGATYSWTVFDGINTTGYTTYSFTAVFEAKKKYQVTLTCDDGVGGPKVQLSNEYNVGNPLQADIKLTREQPETLFKYNFSSMPTGYPPFTYSWDFGDGSPVSGEINPTHIYIQQSAPYMASLSIKDSHNNLCTSYCHVVASSDLPLEANFKATFKPIFNPKTLASVTVVLTDPDGVDYSTRDFLQPAGSKFEILSVNDYKQNERGELTKKLRVRFNCQVKNGNRAVSINNAEAVIAVSYR